MTPETKGQLAELLTRAFARSLAHDGWTRLTLLEFSLKKIEPTFAVATFGYPNLAALLSELPSVVELRTDTSTGSPLELARMIMLSPPTAAAAPLRAPNVTVVQSARAVRPRRTGIALLDWAFMPDLPSTLTALAILALEERWWFGSELDTSYPILWNYLRYTFVRLRQEQKVKETEQELVRLAAFNTGLVDRRYEPIFALFRLNTIPDRQPWRFSSFCIVGEGRDGKDLVRYFRPLPPPAHYFEKVQDMIYDVTAGKPEVDWEHIILENTDRLPAQLLRENVPAAFNFTEWSNMAPPQRKVFFANLADAIRHDKTAYRAIKNRLVDALELAIKRTEWNFKTAIPQYYIKQRKVTLLLPLAVVAEDHVDVALVVEKTPSGNYLGHTILSLEWAYMDARLVCRPDSDWLVPTSISASSAEDDIDATDLEETATEETAQE